MQHTRKTLSLLLTLCMLAGLVPWSVLPARAETDAVPYVDENGAALTCGEYTLIDAEHMPVELSGWCVVRGEVCYTETVMLAGDVNLILCDGAALTVAPVDGVGIKASYYYDNKNYRNVYYGLTVYAQSGGTGSLSVTASGVIDENEDKGLDYVVGATIGNGRYGIIVGSLTVNGGSVTARGADAPDSEHCGGAGVFAAKTPYLLTVNGGTLHAVGGDGAEEHGGSGIHTTYLTVNAGTLIADSGCDAEGAYSGAGLECYGGGMIAGLLTVSGGMLRVNGRSGIIAGRSNNTEACLNGGSVLINSLNTPIGSGIKTLKVAEGLAYSDGENTYTGVLEQERYFGYNYLHFEGRLLHITGWASLQQVIGSGTAPTQLTLYEDFASTAGDAGLTVPAGKLVTLDLNGHKIDRTGRKTDEKSSVIRVEGALIVDDGSEAGNGTLTGGYNNNGGGVYVSGGVFTMNGGTISGNSVYVGKKQLGSGGGGVFVSSGGTFTMNGGTITGNTASGKNCYGGGGVYVTGSSTFTMNGGAITGNKTSEYGGGVYVNGGGTFNLSGGARITGNIRAESESSNLFLYEDINDSSKVAVITVTGALTGGADSIGVWTHVHARVFARPGGERTGALTADEAACFLSDKDRYIVGLNAAGEALLGEPVTVTFDSSGGSAVAPQTVAAGAAAAKPDDPARAGSAFVGWTLDDAAYDFSTPVTEDITLRAQWGVPTAIRDVSISGTTLACTVTDVRQDALLIVAWYDGDGMLIGLGTSGTIRAYAAAEQVEVAVADADAGYTYRVMLVNADSFAPLCAAAEWPQKN